MAIPVKKIILTQRIDFKDDINETRDALDQRLVQWVVTAGYMPYIVPNTLNINDNVSDGGSVPTLGIWLQNLQPHAIVLSGGNDIGQYPQRDESEKYLLSWAANNRVPVLGICRGLQMMGVWAGGTLVKVDGHVRTRHCLVYDENFHGWPIKVNSYHNLALADCPAGFQVFAYAEDGSIEAIRHKDLPWEGWMWHPEREAPFSNKDIKRLKALFGE